MCIRDSDKDDNDDHDEDDNGDESDNDVDDDVWQMVITMKMIMMMDIINKT